MKIGAHPLIVAAALGLLGPAALAEDDAPSDEAPEGIAGQWVLAGPATDVPSADAAPALEIIPFEGRLLVDDGGTSPTAAPRSWVVEPAAATETWSAAGRTITRRFAVDAAGLHVTTRIATAAGTLTETAARYDRLPTRGSV
jgi:hypothetical protein